MANLIVVPVGGKVSGPTHIDTRVYTPFKGHDIAATSNPQRLEEHTIVFKNVNEGAATPIVVNYATANDRDVALTALPALINA